MEYRLSPYRWIILTISIIAYAIVFLHRMSPTVMAEPIMLEMGVDAAFMGLLASAYFYPYAFMQIPSGILSDKTSPRVLMTIALALSGVGTFVFAIASNATLVFIGRLMVGFGVSLVLMPVYKALSYWFTKKSYIVIASTVLAIAGGVGAVLAGMPLSLSIETFGWRNSSLAIAIFSLFVAVVAWFCFKDSPAKMGLPPAEEPESHTHTSEKKPEEDKISVGKAIKTVFSRYNYWIIAIAFFVNAAIYFSFAGLWAGVYYTDVVGLTRNEMSLLLSIAAMITIVTPIIFASIAARMKSRKNVIIVIKAAIFLLMLYFYFRNGSFGKTEIYVWGILFSIIATAPAGLFLTSTRDLFPSNISGTATGLVYAACMFGSAIYQPLIGVFLDNAGYVNMLTAEMFNSVSTLYLVTAAVALVAVFFLKTKNNKLV